MLSSNAIINITITGKELDLIKIFSLKLADLNFATLLIIMYLKALIISMYLKAFDLI